MKINYSYDAEFEQDFNRLKKQKLAEELMELDGVGKQLDIQEFSRRFFSNKGVTTSDVSVDSNSNLDNINIVHYNKEIAKPVQRLNSYYILWKYGRRLFGEEFSYEAMKKQITKELYINDFHAFGTGIPYCGNFTTLDIMIMGLPFVTRTTSKSPKHFDTFLNQVIEFVAYASNNMAGAVGIADTLIVASYYYDKWYKESNGKVNEEYQEKYIRQNIQAFIYRCNQLYRDASQTAFTNISLFDSGFLAKWGKEYVFIDGSKPNIESIKTLQRIYVEEMNKVLSKSSATFPVTTACFSTNKDGKIVDEEFLDFTAKANLKYGFINIYAGKTSTLSSCCRLRSDGENEFFNTFGAGGMKIGSVSVTSLNLPRIAYKSSSIQDFLDKLESNVILCQRINQVRRYTVQKRIDNGHSPIYNYGFMTTNRQYSTCGILGINEAVELMGLDVLNTDGQEFIKDILNVVNSTNKKLSKKYNVPMNCEQVPAENSSLKCVEADKLLGYNTQYELYSNQFIPLTSNADILDRIKLQGMFDEYMTGGAICHLNFSDEIKDVSYMKKIIKLAVESGVVYHAINYNLQKCESEHITVGKSEKCCKCGKKIVENYTRVVGFLVPVKNWSKKRRDEDYPNRKFYKTSEVIL